ncbi:ankyrin repeat-containing domain protein [Lactarius akahatsu]|uniref:Ankyrin repeat-containing domain protein n=1 Tax=Lactarius akahatsu TaxID=416441 RepID=A0AAD4LG98_9AGAM|nr:ankyrin repeat-containing domain protein [Lactarius akahatsu]
MVSQGLYNPRDHPPIDHDIARLLVERGADVNAQDEDKNTPLHSAALGGRLEIVQVLLDHGASAVVENGRGESSLHLVSKKEYPRYKDGGAGIAQLLLERGVDVNALDEHQNTPLHSAAFRGVLEIVKVLLDHGAIVDAENDEGKTPFNLVLRGDFGDYDRVGIARLLLERGADVNARKKNNTTPLYSAIFNSATFYGWVEIAQMLINRGAIADAKNDKGETPLNLVSRGRYYPEDGVGFARLLLERGVDVNAQSKSKITPLHSAAFRGKLEIARVLLDYDAIADAENDEGETPLHLVSRGDYRYEEGGIGIARLLLERGVDVNAQNKSKTTPLHSAAFKGRHKIVQVLLDHGAIADAENDEGETPLRLVSRGDYYPEEDGVSIARLLLERGVDVNGAQNKNKITSLHSAAFKGRLKIVQVLLDYGAIADAENDEGETPLHLVSRGDYRYEEGGVGIARLLLERGVDVNAQNRSKTTPLHSAALKGRLKIVQVLLDYGAIADAENDEGENPLHRASRGDYNSEEDGVCIVRLLLERGIDVNARDKNKTTPLHSATFKGRFEIVKVLLDYGAIAGAENNEGKTPLNLVLRKRLHSKQRWPPKVGFGIVRLLLARGVDVNSQDKYHNTPLHSAAFNHGPRIAHLLLDHGANPCAENEQGETLLHEVSRIKDDSRGIGIARLLLGRGVDVHAQDKDHNTALHSAAFNGRLGLAQVLLDHAANPTAENDQGETPLHLLSRGKSDHGVGLTRLLVEHGVDVNGRKRNMWTPLHLAAVKGMFKIARELLDHGANPNAEDEQGETPLHVVSQGKYDSQEDGVSIARLLLARGADVNALDKDQHTPFYSASYFGRFEIARLLFEYSAKVTGPSTRGTKRKAEDVGNRFKKRRKLHEEAHLAPWRTHISPS